MQLAISGLALYRFPVIGLQRCNILRRLLFSPPSPLSFKYSRSLLKTHQHCFPRSISSIYTNIYQVSFKFPGMGFFFRCGCLSQTIPSGRPISIRDDAAQCEDCLRFVRTDQISLISLFFFLFVRYLHHLL